jgi:hypothetical protein
LSVELGTERLLGGSRGGGKEEGGGGAKRLVKDEEVVVLGVVLLDPSSDDGGGIALKNDGETEVVFLASLFADDVSCGGGETKSSKSPKGNLARSPVLISSF